MASSGLERFASVEMTTLERLKAKLDPSGTDTSQDAILSQLIGEVSAQATSYLGFHTLSEQRTEVHRVRRGQRILTLDARPISGEPSITYGTTQALAVSGATMMDSACYFLRDQSGWLEFTPAPASELYLSVQYTGGLAGTATELVAAYPDIADAIDLQVSYRYKRQSSPGGNVTSLAGGSTQYDSQYGLLKNTKATLDRYKRGWL